MEVKTKKMKGIEMLCASPAATSICESTITKPLHRLNSYLGDHYRNFTYNLPNYTCSSPCISQLPLTPRKLSRSDPHYNSPRRRSSADVYNLPKYHKHTTNNFDHSSRHLLSDSPFSGSLPSSDFDYPTKESSELLLPCTTSLVHSEERQLRKSRSVHTGRVGSLMNVAHTQAATTTNNNKPVSLALANPSNQRVIKSEHPRNNDHDSPAARSSSSLAPSPEQVVALRVSLHCKACEAKLRKHISNMEGVTSFSIDKESKKVVVIGKMTPSNVLASISKVKKAQFWQSPSSSS